MKNILRVVNGDRLSFDLKLTLNNEEYILGLGEKVWFTVYDGENLEDTNIKLNIVQEETTKIDIPSIDLEPGDYNFDVGIIFTDGTTKTLLANQRNYRNVLRVLPRGCNNKSVTGVIFEDAFNVEIYDCNHGCYDTVRLYKIIKDLDSKSFITVDTIEDRDSIPEDRLSNGKVVRVNNNGNTEYYQYTNGSWTVLDLGNLYESIENVTSSLYSQKPTMSIGFDSNGIISECHIVKTIATLFGESSVSIYVSPYSNKISESVLSSAINLRTIYVDNTSDNIDIDSGIINNENITIYYRGEFNLCDLIINSINSLSSLVGSANEYLENTLNGGGM